MTQFCNTQCITFGPNDKSLLTPDGRLWIWKGYNYKCKICTRVTATIKTPYFVIDGQHHPNCKAMDFAGAKAMYIPDYEQEQGRERQLSHRVTSPSTSRCAPAKTKIIMKKKKQQRVKKVTTSNRRTLQSATPTSDSNLIVDEIQQDLDEVFEQQQHQEEEEQDQQEEEEVESKHQSMHHQSTPFSSQTSPSFTGHASTSSFSTTISRASSTSVASHHLKMETDIDDDDEHDDAETLEETIVPRSNSIIIMPPPSLFSSVIHAPQSDISNPLSSTSHFQNEPIDVVADQQPLSAFQTFGNVTEGEEGTEGEQFFDDQNYSEENEAFKENEESEIQEIEAKPELKYERDICIFNGPSEDAIIRACKVLKLRLEDSRTAYRFWSQISVTIVKSSSRNIEIGSKYTPFDVLSLYLTGDANRGAELWKKMDVKLSGDEEMKEHLGPEKVYQMCLNFSPVHFMLLAHWTKCRIGIFEYGELAQRYGNWKEKSQITILILKNGQFYSPIFQL